MDHGETFMTYGAFLIFLFMDKKIQLFACMIYSKGVALTLKNVWKSLKIIT